MQRDAGDAGEGECRNHADLETEDRDGRADREQQAPNVEAGQARARRS